MGIEHFVSAITMFIIIFVSFLVDTFGLLTTVPENAAVMAGIKVVMKCRTNETSKQIYWRALLIEILPNKISNGERIAAEWSEICYIDNTSAGQYDLIINSTMSIGTQYFCQEGPFGHANGNMGTAELVVLAADPKCSINRQIEDEKVKLNETNLSFEMRCTVGYSGNWTPLIEWRQVGCQEPIYRGVNTTVQDDTVISTLTVSANVTYNLTRYICTTRFDKRHKPSSTTADNVPNYSYNWTSPIIVNTNDNPATTSSFSETKALSQYFDSSSLAILLLSVLLFISISVIVAIVLRFTACRKILREPVTDIPLRSQLSEDAENSTNLAERMSSADPAYEEVDLQNASNTSPKDHTTGGSASESQYSALIHDEENPCNYETLNLPNSSDDL